MNSLAWQLHDAVIIRCSLERERWVLDVQLYEIYYPQKPVITLTFSGIYNQQGVQKLHEAITADGDIEPGWNGTRINAFQYDTTRPSKENDLYLFLHADHTDSMTIHCQRFTATENNL